jgi:hypothetical protein
MSGWIKIDKDLPESLRFKRVVRKLRESSNALRGVTSPVTAHTIVLGALAKLWMHADTHIQNDDILEATTDEIDELVGVDGFAAALPADWLQVVDAEHVKLTDFLAHNGGSARERKQGAKRQAAYRSRKQERNVTASNALRDEPRPDQTRPEETRPEEREERAHKARGVRDMGTGLTTIRPLEGWRRDVPECNPDAFASWIVHCELSGKVLGEPQRMLQARQLAKNGDFAVQAEVVEYCISQGWKSLVPIDDVRARRDGMSRTGSAKRPQHDAPTTAELEALEAARAGH